MKAFHVKPPAMSTASMVGWRGTARDRGPGPGDPQGAGGRGFQEQGPDNHCGMATRVSAL